MDEATALDASPVILLARAGFLDLLRVFNQPLVILAPVADEILQKGPDDIAARALQRTGFFASVPAPEVDPFCWALESRPWRNRGPFVGQNTFRQLGCRR